MPTAETDSTELASSLAADLLCDEPDLEPAPRSEFLDAACRVTGGDLVNDVREVVVGVGAAEDAVEEDGEEVTCPASSF